MIWDHDAPLIEQDALPVLTLSECESGVPLVTARQGLQDLERCFVSLVCLLKEESQRVTPVTGRVIRQQTQSTLVCGLRLFLCPGANQLGIGQCVQVLDAFCLEGEVPWSDGDHWQPWRSTRDDV